MTEAIAQRTRIVRPDSPQGQHLRFVPILGPSHGQPPYALLSSDHLDKVKITEISAAGSVPEVKVRNDLDVRLFLMDGQELVGAKQNRILNTDVLVPARSTLTIPVSCVEAGRWHTTSAAFKGGKSASHRVRSGKSRRVYDSLRARRRHDADQHAVWNEVACSLASSDTVSQTMALADAYAQRQRELSEFRSALHLPAEAVGMAIFHRGRFQGLDLFDRHATLRYFWDSLVDSYAIDLLHDHTGAAGQVNESEGVGAVLARAAVGKWEAFDSPGEGQDWRLGDELLSGSALVWDNQVVLHLQLFAQPRQDDPQPPSRRPRLRRRYWPDE